jgi:hypothetical protein
MVNSDKGSIHFPDNRNYEYALNQSFQLAADSLRTSGNMDEVCVRSGSLCQRADVGKAIVIEFLSRVYRISFPEMNFSIVDSRDEVTLREKVLILHYLITAKGTPLSGNLITFKELPEGAVYFRTFSQRTLKPLADNFGKEPGKLIEAAQSFGGQKAALGDASVTLKVFKMVPVTLVVWAGDAEFPPEAGIMYDSTITDYLPVEDIIVLTEILVWKLVRLNK